MGGWERLETRPFLLIRCVVNFALAYLFFSLALDSGSLIQYALTIAFILFGLRNLIKGTAQPKHGKR